MSDKNTLLEYQKYVDQPAEYLLCLVLDIVFAISKDKKADYLNLIGATEDQYPVLFKDVLVFQDVRKPIINNPVNSKVLESYYVDFISKIANDANKKLFLELIFLSTLSTFEKLIPSVTANSKRSENDISNEQIQKRNKSQLHDLKLLFYSICIDFSNYLVSETQDAQSDLSFILISKITDSNDLDLIYRFWEYMVSRRYELIKFAELDNNAYYTRARTSQNTIKTKSLLGIRRPGSVLIKLVKKLVARINGGEGNFFAEKTDFIGALNIYVADMFSITDQSLDNGFAFNQDVVVHATSFRKKPGDEKFFRFWRLQELLANPFKEGIGAKTKDYILLDQFDIVSEYSKIALAEYPLTNNDVSPIFANPNQVNEDLRNFIEHGDVKFVKDFYARQFCQDKLGYYSKDETVSYATCQIASRELFDVQKKRDSRFRLQVLIQIYIMCSFLFNTAEKYKRENHQQMVEYLKKMNKFVAGKKDANETIKDSQILSYAEFKSIYPSLTNRSDLDYYIRIKKNLAQFFESYNKSLYFTANTLAGQQDLVWFYWKLSLFNLFNYLPNDDKFADELNSKFKKKMEAVTAYADPFGIKLGNRNLTKVLTTKHSIDLQNNEKEILDKNDSLRQELGQNPNSETVKSEYNLSLWKKSRLVRKRGGWLTIETDQFFQSSKAEVDKSYVPESVQKNENENLKRKLEELKTSNVELIASNTKKLKTRYVSLSKDEDDDEEKNALEDVPMKSTSGDFLEY